jgi:hypothetical protein
MTLFGVGCWGLELAVSERACRRQQPVEHLAQLGRRGGAGGGEVAIGVVDRARQHVEVVVQAVELVARDHQLVFAQLQLARPLARHPVPLPATLAAELSRPAASLTDREHPAAPPATGQRLLLA